MKLRNKKTGEIIDFASIQRDYDGANDIGLVEIGHERGDTIPVYSYRSLAELNKEWEDYNEPKEYWFVSDLDGKPMKCELRYCPVRDFDDWVEKRKLIGNCFETEEEAEKAVEKLKAWKRLKDAGCKIVGWDYSDNVDLNGCKFNDDDFIIGLSAGDIDEEDLDLLFGGKDDA